MDGRILVSLASQPIMDVQTPKYTIPVCRAAVWFHNGHREAMFFSRMPVWIEHGEKDESHFT